jgi:UDP-N-acetylmuramate--alanine ligase
MYKVDLKNPKHAHFIGIGGISMSGLAEILADAGFTVSGSDMKASPLTEQLSALGADVAIGQREENIKDGTELVVYSAAIHEENPEFAETLKKGIPILSRADLLGQIMANFLRSIAVSGTHGKTTTTSMLTHILLQCDMDPTVSIGGMLDRIGGNIRIGRSDVFLTEACEYTNSFLSLYPLYSIILNVEEDHMDFFKDLDDIISSFRTFAFQTDPSGLIIINGDMPHTDAVLEGAQAAHVTFGLSKDNDYSAEDIVFDEAGNVSYTLLDHGQKAGTIRLNVKGVHNVSNSLAAIACTRAMGLPMDMISRGLLSFGGTHRRFEFKGKIGDVTVIDDYAHHPTEIEATLKAASKISHDDLWVVFQPHTYTRTRAFLPQFARALSSADHVVLADIYAAREPDTGLVSSKDLADLITQAGADTAYFHTFEEIEAYLLDRIRGKDLVLTVGAGNIVELGEELLQKAADNQK